ncbi:hypothetical protein [Ralstonia sp. ASV6]|uniref:hypothetical protein n=1 Tax=Ralstonia sp. ASV6 TaxID=2795124 RepID=UPI0018EE2A20|nr:hypothetical protein [Ralstonia sp. ASV6]
MTQPIELSQHQVDMAAALKQGRVFVNAFPTNPDYPYAVVAERHQEQGTSSVWMVDQQGNKSPTDGIGAMPIPNDNLMPLDMVPDYKAVLEAVQPAPSNDALIKLGELVTAAQDDFAQRGLNHQAAQLGEVKSFLEKYGLPKAENQLMLLNALNRTTDALRLIFRATCEKVPFPRGSECDNKLQAICEGDIALKTVGERDQVWTQEKANVAKRQGWQLAPANDGTMGLSILAAPGGKFASDVEAYQFVCEQAKERDLLAMTACREAGITLAGVNEYRPPSLDI